MSHDSPSFARPPRAAYVHIPFCRRRCGYCNFTVIAGRDDLREDYLRALEMELARLQQPHAVDTLFCGGGTPTHLGPAWLQRLFEMLGRWLPLRPGGEFSVEANPEDIDLATVDVLSGAGVNRVSLGVQSFLDDKLRVLERAHRAEHVERCVELLRPRVQNLSLDLIFGVPGESLASWQRDLESAIRMRPQHISTYGLTYERGARFYGQLQKSELTAVDEEVERAMYELAIDLLVESGFEHYEVSNFARAGFRCEHNENYWLGGEYLAFGPGAASYRDGRRVTNHRSTTTYLRRVLAGLSPEAEGEQLDAEGRARERLVFGLRRLQGVDRHEFAAAHGVSIEQLVGPHLAPLLERNLLRWSEDRLQLTRQGLLISDSIWPYFL